MRRVRFGRALLVAFAVGCSLVVPGPAVAAAAETCPTADACVFVHTSSGVQVVSGAEVDAWANQAVGTSNGVSNATYQERFSSGGDPQTVQVGLALSVNALLKNLGIDPSTVFTEMPRGDGTGSLADLTSSELAIPTSFQGPDLPAFWINGFHQLFFVRPLRSDTDVNAPDDLIQTSQGGVIDLFVYTGAMLQVTASGPPSGGGAPKQSLTFTAESSPTAGGETPTFTWTFSDGSPPVQGQQVTHSFAADDTYTADVTAAGTGSDDSFGALDQPLFVNVTGATPSGTPSPTTTPGGGHSSPPSTPKPGPSNGKGHQPTSPATPRPSASPSATGSDSGVTGTSLPGPSLSAVAPTARKPLVANPAKSTPPPTAVLDNDNLPLVRGQLIGPGAVVLSGAQLGSAQAGVSPAGRLSGGWRAAGLVGSVAAIMLLFVAGAARELRWFRRLRRVVGPR